MQSPPDHVYRKLRKLRDSYELSVRDVPLDQIIVDEVGRRPLDEKTVTRLMESITEVGLISPISLRPLWDDKAVSWKLVSGHHRLTAYRRLLAADITSAEEGGSPWDSIPAVVMPTIDDIDARLHEIAENLHRAKLTTQERAEQIAEWVRLTERKREAISAQLEQKPQGGRPEGGISAAARHLGIDRMEADRAVKIAAITPEAKEAAREAGLDDNQAALLKVAGAEPARQVDVVSGIAEAKALKVQQDVQNRAANEIAEMVVTQFDRDGIECFRVNMAVTTAKAVTAALANLLGQSVMDRRFGTER